MKDQHITKTRAPQVGWLYWVYAGMFIVVFSLLYPTNDGFSLHAFYWGFGVPHDIVSLRIAHSGGFRWSYNDNNLVINVMLWGALFLIPYGIVWAAVYWRTDWCYEKAVAYRLMAIAVLTALLINPVCSWAPAFIDQHVWRLPSTLWDFNQIARVSEPLVWFVAIVVLIVGVVRRLREASPRLAWWVARWLWIMVFLPWVVLLGEVSESVVGAVMPIILIDGILTFDRSNKPARERNG